MHTTRENKHLFVTALQIVVYVQILILVFSNTCISKCCMWLVSANIAFGGSGKITARYELPYPRSSLFKSLSEYGKVMGRCAINRYMFLICVSIVYIA